MFRSDLEPIVVHDLTFATRQKQLTGIERYAINLFRASARRSERAVGIVVNSGLLAPDLPIMKMDRFTTGWISLSRMMSRKAWRSAVMVCACAPASPSLLMSRVPVARVIHDNFAWTRSATLSVSGRLLFRDYETAILNRNNLLFAPTTIAQEELQATLDRYDIGLAGNATGVDYEGPEIRPAAVQDGLDFNLLIGTVEPRKNYERLVRLVEADLTGGRTVVVAGRRGWHGSGDQLERSAATGRLIWLKEATDSEIRWLYRHCCHFVSLSHAEGFNMPLVEAGGYRCSILCSDIPIHRSVAPPWARFIPPDCPDASIDQMLRDAPVRAPDAAAYRAKFSWNSVVEAIESPLMKIWQERRQ